MAKSTGHSSREPGFNSQHPHGGWQLLLSPVQGDQMFTSGLCGQHAHGWWIYVHTNPHIHKIKKFKLLTLALLNLYKLGLCLFPSTWMMNFDPEEPQHIKNSSRVCYVNKLYTSLTLFTCHQPVYIGYGILFRDSGKLSTVPSTSIR